MIVSKEIKKGEYENMRRTKKAAALLLTSVMAVSLAACGGGTEEKESAGKDKEEKVTLKITWWGSQSRHEYTQKMLDLYKEEHPEIEFEAVPAGWDGYFDKLATQAASGSMPDIVQMDYLYISTYAQNNSVADLQPYIDDGTIDTKNIDENLLNSGKINGKMAGLVLSSSMSTMVYNPQVLEMAGVEEPTADWNWDDFWDINRKLNAGGVTDSASIDPTYDSNQFHYWVRQHGEKLFSEDNKSLGYEDDQLLADYLDMWKTAMDDNLVPTPDEYEQINTLGLEASPIVTNDTAFSWNWNNYTTLVAASNDKLKMTTLPVTGEDDKKGLWLKPGSFFSVSETCEHKKEAAEFIDWFINSEEANDIMMAERGTPVSSEIRQHMIDSGKLTPQQQDMFQYIDDAKPMTSETPAPDPVGMAEVNKVFKDTANAVFYDQQTSMEAAASFRKQANEILERNNK